MVELSGDDVESLGAASVCLGANCLRIGKSRLLGRSACTGRLDLQLLFTRISGCSGETSAGGESLLCGHSAGQAARLAPAKKTVGFAVLGAVLACGRIALRACRGNANGRREARVELAMVELSGDDVESLGAASVCLGANCLRIGKSRLLGRSACTGGLDLQLLFTRISGCHTPGEAFVGNEPMPDLL